MYTVYHGSWRDFTTAVGAIVCTEMNTIFGATFVCVRLAALARHTLRLWALTRPSAQPTVPGQRE